jgi:hypothetical protein
VSSNKSSDNGTYVLWPRKATRKTTAQMLVPRMSEDYRSGTKQVSEQGGLRRWIWVISIL